MVCVAKNRFSPTSVLLGLALSACSGSSGAYSGRYEVDLGGGKEVLDFHGSNEVKVSLVSPDGKDSISHNCVYAQKGDKLFVTTDEPMGAPMTLVIVDGKLTDGAGTVFQKK